jgi:DNA-binding transcriptional LysR family regulator
VAVAEELHFGKAAARLHIAQPAVSQTIRSMESELGLILFDRTNRRVELTDAGRCLLDEAEAVLDRFDAAIAAMSRLRSGEAGQVHIGAVPALPPELVPRLLATFAAEAPEVGVVVRPLPSGRRPRQALEGSDFDLALVRGEVSEPGLDGTVVAREPVGVALPVDHPLASRDAIEPSDLNGVPLVSFGRTTDPVEYDRIYGPLAAAGLTDLRLAYEGHEGAVEASLRLVESGVGLSLKLATEVGAFARARIVWRPLRDVAVDVVVSAAWRPDRLTPALGRLVALLPPSHRVLSD